MLILRLLEAAAGARCAASLVEEGGPPHCFRPTEGLAIEGKVWLPEEGMERSRWFTSPGLKRPDE